MAYPGRPDDASRRLRALLVTERSFMKAYDGSAAVYRAWLDHLLSCGYEVSVLSFNQARVRWDKQAVEQLRARVHDLLIVDVTSSMAMAGVRQMADMAWRLATGRRYPPEWLERLVRSPERHQIAEFLQRHDFDLVVVNKIRNTQLVGSGNLAKVRGVRVVDIHDNDPKRSLLLRRSALALLPRLPKVIARMLRVQEMGDILNWAGCWRMMREELGALSVYDQVLFSSREEAEEFRAAGLPDKRIRISPWPYETIAGIGECAPLPVGPRPYHLGMIGASGLFNLEGVVFLADHILPRLRQSVPGLKLLIAGGVCKQARHVLGGDPSVTLVSWVDRLEDFYHQVEVVGVPLLSGTGVSVKSLEAAWLGSAIVSTRTGVRGLELADQRDFLLADSPDAFAAAVIRVLGDEALRTSLRANAAREIRVRHSSAAFAAALASLFDDSRGKA